MLNLPTLLSAMCLWLTVLGADASGPGCTPYGCRQPGCRDISTINITVERLYELFPLYLQITNNEGDSLDVDNVCYTNFRLNDFAFVFIRSTVYKNGENKIRVSIESDVQGCPGFFKELGAADITDGCLTTVNNLYAAGEACPGALVFYLCTVFGVGVSGDKRFRFGASSDPDLSTCCKDRLIDIASSLFERSNNTFVVLPNRLPKKCVTSFNGAMAVRAETVSPSNSTSLPM